MTPESEPPRKLRKLKTTAANSDKNIERAFKRIAGGKFFGEPEHGMRRSTAWRIAEMERKWTEGEDASFAP